MRLSPPDWRKLIPKPNCKVVCCPSDYIECFATGMYIEKTCEVWGGSIVEWYHRQRNQKGILGIVFWDSDNFQYAIVCITEVNEYDSVPLCYPTKIVPIGHILIPESYKHLEIAPLIEKFLKRKTIE